MSVSGQNYMKKKERNYIIWKILCTGITMSRLKYRRDKKSYELVYELLCLNKTIPC